MRRVLGLLLLEAFLLSAVPPAFAAPPAAPGGAAAEDDDAEALVGGAARESGGGRGPMLVVLRIAEKLHLSDEQTIKVASEFRRIAQQRRELVAKRAALATKLEAQLAQEPRDDAGLTALTDQMVALEQQLVLLPEQLWKGVQPVLNPEQRARLILLRGKMKQQLDGVQRRRGGAAAGNAGNSGATADPRD
jgi:Spy/CpxP family protein refolding chaperone